VAATDTRSPPRGGKAGAIIAAALSLPGVIVPAAALADTAPERGEIAIKYLQYQDSQPDLSRIRVRAPSVYAMVPLSPKWSVEGSWVSDTVSGATPRYHTAVSGATRKMSDKRIAEDVKVTRYEDRSSYSLSLSHSGENDYQSNAGGLSASFSSDDNNRTWNVGFGYAADRISSTNDPTLHQRKNTVEFMVGVTQAWTANDLVQVNLTLNHGHGYYSDPYKEPDIRPNQRTQSILLTRWNHHFSEMSATLKSSYRYYRDNFGINAHTVGAEWVQPVGDRWTVTPELRYYTQGAASFYYDPVYDPAVGAPYPPGYFTNPPQFISPDQRLSAFGAITAGLRVALKLSADWTVDVKAERYEQRGSWRLGGQGSPGLEPFRATFLQFGVSTRF
jgi:hypothetical protein